MGQVTLELNGRTYRLRCDDGQEKRLTLLGNYIAKHLNELKQDLGQIGEDRLLLMAALMVADELMDAKDELKKLSKNRKSKGKDPKIDPPKVAKEIEVAASRVEALKERLVKTDE
ncbi:MAG: cell division protein ZapA [Pseudomonadota bacterium]